MHIIPMVITIIHTQEVKINQYALKNYKQILNFFLVGCVFVVI